MKLVLLLAACVALTAGSLLDFFSLCDNKTDLETCLINALEAIRPRLKYGIPEIQLPPWDPYILDEVDIDVSLPHLDIKCTARNVRVYGASDFRIHNFRIDERTYAFEIKLTLPHITVTADYSTPGSQIFYVNLNGHGKFKGHFNGITVFIQGLARPAKSNNVHHLAIQSLVTKIKFPHSELSISPNQGSFAARAAAAYIDARPAAIMEMLAPVVEDYVAPIIKKRLGNLMKAWSTNRLLTD